MSRPSAFLPGFEVRKEQVNGVGITYAISGDGPAVLLLHGHPQTHIVWRKIAPTLVTAGYRVIAPDLRGYGDSDTPESDPDHRPYSKREMAKDQVALLRKLGHHSASVVGHDRGGRVAHRMALDHPDVVETLTVLDIAPTATMYAQTTKEFATRYFWWFFLIQPFDLPERLISSDPEYFLRRHIGGQAQTPDAVSEDAFAEYLRCYDNPETIHAICEDYRAAASIDLHHDAADAGTLIEAPLLAVWGEKGVVGQLFDVIDTWQDKARSVEGVALPCGHAIPEECPQELLALLLAHFDKQRT